MACDSLYCAWLKVHYPYELYVTMLKLYDEKKNTDKISAIIAEMKRYKDIHLLAGKWGQDNRDWLVDKEHKTISQSLSSIRFMSRQAAQDLYELSQKEEADIGVEIIPAKLNKEGKALMKRLKETVKHAQEIADHMTDEQMQDYNRQVKDLESQIYSCPECLESPYQEIHHTAKLDNFSSVLRAIQMNTTVNSRQIEILIELGYFSQFGGSAKLMKVFKEFTEGKRKMTKVLKSFTSRLDELRKFEESLPDEELPIQFRLKSEQENIGLCLTTDQSASPNTYFVRNVDEKWGTTVTLYSVCSGKTGNVRFKKDDIKKNPVAPNQMITILDGNSSPRYTYKNGQRTPVPGEKEYWVKSYSIFRPA